MAVLDGSPRSYLKTAVLTWLGLSLLCVAVCIFADPYRLFGIPPIKGLTALKPRSYQQFIMTKTVQLDRTRPRTLLLGNSRVENGFDPGSKVWPARMQPVFNAGLPGTDMFMAERMLDQALAGGRLKTVVLEADFPDFLNPPVAADYERPLSDNEGRMKVDRAGHPNPARFWRVWEDRVHATLTLDALTDSLLTVKQQNPRFGITMTPAGFNPLRQYELEVRHLGYEGLFAQKLAAYRQQYARSYHPDFRHPERTEDFRYLSNIVRKTRAHDVELVIFIPPYHAEFLDLMREQGRWTEFQDWKRALVRVVSDASGGQEVKLVDFSGYNSFTTERVPSKGDTRTAMRWYWEPGHYKATLGDEVLGRLINGRGSFGVALSPATIEAALPQMNGRGAEGHP